MNIFIDKFKKFIDFILNYLKSLLTSIFGVFADIFKIEKQEEELVSKNLEAKEERQEVVSQADFSSVHNEEPNTLELTPPSSILNISLEELQFLIKKVFCEELEIKEEFLTDKEKEYIKDLEQKLVPKLNKDITNMKFTSKDTLIDEIHELVTEDLESQLKLEQNFDNNSEKIVISPLIYERKQETITMSTNPNTFFKKKKDQVKAINPSLEIPPIAKKVAEIPIVNEILSNFKSLKDKKPEEINNDVVDLREIPPTITPNIVEPPVLDNQELVQGEIEELDVLPSTIEEITPAILDNSPIEDMPKDPFVEVLLEEVQTPIYDTYESKKIEEVFQSIQSSYQDEEKKELLEDKNYEIIEKQIQALLEEIERLKLKNLSPDQAKKLKLQEQQIIDFRDNVLLHKQKEIDLENNLLNETILMNTLNDLQGELEKLHLEDKLDLQKHLLNSLEDLNTLNPLKAKEIEKELLKEKLRKTIKAMEITSFLSFPFLKNKYLLYLAMGLFANRHLKLFNAILKRKTLTFEPDEELSHILKGSHALEDAIFISLQNIEYLNLLEMQALEKYPDLALDNEYMTYIEHLKSLFLKNQEMLLRKKKVIQKYNIKTQKYVRKLQKKENPEN